MLRAVIWHFFWRLEPNWKNFWDQATFNLTAYFFVPRLTHPVNYGVGKRVFAFRALGIRLLDIPLLFPASLRKPSLYLLYSKVICSSIVNSMRTSLRQLKRLVDIGWPFCLSLILSKNLNENSIWMAVLLCRNNLSNFSIKWWTKWTFLNMINL